MTSTIKVNNIQNQCGANIINESSNTITIGASGDTVSLASGASQSGFGRAGSVDWQTGSIKTATFTATSGEGYFCNTTAGVFTVNLPSSPSAGDIVAVSDYAKTFDTNNLTMGRGGSNIEGAASDIILDAESIAMTFVDVDATKGWKVVGAGREADKTATDFVIATGGTVTESGNFKIHTFTGPGTFEITQAGTGPAQNMDYLVVAGGGAGGMGATASSGGGGAGGLRFSADQWCAPSPVSPRAGSALTTSIASFPITVGAGGAELTPSNPGQKGNNGNNSVFSTITSTAGGGGAGHNDTNGNPGGSGGGGASGSPVAAGTGGSGNTPPVSPPQGNDGGNSGPHGPDNYVKGGGGGAGTAGAPQGPSPLSPTGGVGGAGLQVNIDTNNYYWAGGGGGSAWVCGPNAAPGGIGGGGGGSTPSSNPGNAGSGGGSALNAGSAGTKGGGAGAGGANTGGGGGSSNVNTGNTGAGGSGIVIIRYRFQ